MHDAGARYGGERRIEREQRVLQGTAAIARTRMNDEARRLVDHEEAWVFMHDRERHARLARPHAFVGDELRLHAKMLACHRTRASQRRYPVLQHAPFVDPTLQPCARILRQQPSQHDVEAQVGELGRNDQIVRRAVHGRGYNSAMSTLPRSSRKSGLRLGFALAFLLTLGACSTNRDANDLAKGGPAAVYERARKSLDNQDYENAIRLYEALVARFPFGAEARQARLDLIYAYYKGRESESALDQADTFMRENPTHPRIDYALYIKGLVEFERSANFFERWFDVDLDARPPQTARSAFNSFRRIVVDYPKSEYAHDARRRMLHLRNRLADYELYVARHYVDRGAWVGAARRARETIEQYDGSPAVREALEILIQSYERLEMKELADQTREVYALNYGGTTETVVPVKRSWWKFWD